MGCSAAKGCLLDPRGILLGSYLASSRDETGLCGFPWLDMGPGLGACLLGAWGLGGLGWFT